MEDFTTVQKRLLYLIQQVGLDNPTAFSREIGNETHESFLRVMRTDGSKPSSDILTLIAKKYPDISLGWLLAGVGKPFYTTNIVQHNKNTPPVFNEEQTPYAVATKATTGIPLVSSEAIAGMLNATIKIDQADIQAHYIVPDFKQIDFMLRVVGNSMYPKYTSGDVVACRILKSSSFIQWNRPHLIAAGEHGLLIKRIMPGADNTTYTLVSDNKDYPPIVIPVSEVHGLALIVGTIRLE